MASGNALSIEAYVRQELAKLVERLATLGHQGVTARVNGREADRQLEVKLRPNVVRMCKTDGAWSRVENTPGKGNYQRLIGGSYVVRITRAAGTLAILDVTVWCKKDCNRTILGIVLRSID